MESRTLGRTGRQVSVIGVSTVIPGASTPEQGRANAAAAALPPLDQPLHDALTHIYEDRIRAHVHDRW